MASGDQMNAAQRKFELTRQFYKRACSEGRGDQALAKLRTLKAAKAETYQRSDDEIRTQMQKWADEERAEVRRIIEDCVNKTDFDREEDDPIIRQYMIDDLEEQALVIHILREQGCPEGELPLLNRSFARLNAYERREGREQRWSYQDDPYQGLRMSVHNYSEEYRQFLKQKPPVPSLN